MKTLTEFPSPYIKNAAQVKTDLLAAGKSPEELPQSLGEALKIEGDRLTFLLHTLEIIGSKLNDLKRAVVYSLSEGEKISPSLTQKGENAYLVEYYPPLVDKTKPKAGFSKEPKGRRDGKRKNRKKRGKGQAGRENRPSDQNPLQAQRKIFAEKLQLAQSEQPKEK